MNQIETKERKSRGKKSFPIVRVGASAGGLEAIETFFANMPTNVGMAFVVIQHLSPQHKSILGDILKKDTPMQVVEVQDGMNIVPSCIYSVSYTHLRAHETDSYLVCRLLLE